MLGRFSAVKGPGLILLIPIVQQMVQGRSAHPWSMDVPQPGRDLARQRLGEGQRGGLLPRDRPRAGDHPGRGLHGRRPASSRRPRCARCSASTSSTRCWPSATSSTSTSRRSSTQQTDAWGIKVANVEIKHVDIDESMIRAIAKQAEAERARRAKVIHAEGELQAAAEAGGGRPTCCAAQPAGDAAALSRARCTTSPASGPPTIVFPLPMDLPTGLRRRPHRWRAKSMRRSFVPTNPDRRPRSGIASAAPWHGRPRRSGLGNAGCRPPPR